MGEDVALIDSGKETAYLIKTMLEKNEMLSENEAEYEYYVSDSIEDFSENAERFLGRKIKENLFKKVF
jgi:glutamate racemase